MNAATPTISSDAADALRLVDAADAVIEQARAAAVQDSGSPTLVGDFLGSVTEDDVAVTVRFATTDVAYTGWAWCVTVALVDPEQPTISEVVLLPGPGSLLPPAWLPWSERIRPGDLGPGDLLLPPTDDDPRLAPAYLESDDPAVEDVAHELGIGRVRVMSRAGRTDSAERWHDGSFGPTADMAKQAPLQCVMCAFFLPLAGSLGAQFGACGNEMSPADGRVVDLGFGCGAHSELVIEPVPTGFRPSHIDDTVLDVHPRGAALVEGAAAFLGDDDSVLEIGPARVPAVEPAQVFDTGEPDAVSDPEVAAADAPPLEDARVDGADAAAELEQAPVEDVVEAPAELEQAAVEDVVEAPAELEQAAVEDVVEDPAELEEAPVEDAVEAPAELEEAPVEDATEVPVGLDAAPAESVESPVEAAPESATEAAAGVEQEPAPGDADA